MRLRTRHLACLILLLSALGGANSSAEAPTPRHGDFTLGGHYITALLAHEHAAVCAQAALVHHTNDLSNLALPAALLMLHRAAWTMRSPSSIPPPSRPQHPPAPSNSTPGAPRLGYPASALNSFSSRP